MREINFDMDGTIANFYSVEGWLNDLMNGNDRPYKEAKPMINFSSLARQIHRLQKLGYKINIISWLAKNSTEEFDNMVINTKIEWLNKHLPSVQFDNITIVPYGTPKSTCGCGMLFDDEENNRLEWEYDAYNVHNILEILREIEC